MNAQPFKSVLLPFSPDVPHDTEMNDPPYMSNLSQNPCPAAIESTNLSGITPK